MPLPAIIGALGALAAGGLSHLSARSQQERAIQSQRSLQALLLSNSGAVQARNAKQAGLSPAFSLGSSSVPTVPSTSAPSAQFDSSGVQSLLGGLSLRKLQKQQAKTEAAETKVQESQAAIYEQKAKQEELITRRMQGEANSFNQPTVTTDENGVTVTSPVDTAQYGAYYQGLSEGQLKQAEMNLKKQGFDVQSIEYQIREGVLNKQVGDDKILRAMSQLPVAQLDQIRASATDLYASAREHDSSALLKGAQKLYTEMETALLELKKNEYESGSVDALFKNFSVENLFKWLLRNLLDIVHLGGNVGKQF